MQGGLGISMKINFMSILFLFAFISITFLIQHAYAEETQSLQIEVKYTNGDRIDAYQTDFVVYQDSDKSPFLEKKLESNPETIVLPKDHRYKVEVYVNGMFSEVGYVELNNESKKLEIKIPLPGGLKFNVFFEDGETPIEGATLIIKSQDGQEQKIGKTDDLGQTMRYWLQSTSLIDNYYIAEVYFDDYLLTSVSNIKVHQGISQEQKIKVPIPSIIEELITFTLFDTGSNPIMKANGNYSVLLISSDENQFLEPISGSKGEIYFSSIPSGVYSVHVLKNNEIDPLWKESEVIVTGKQNEFKLIQENPISLEISEETVDDQSTDESSDLETNSESVIKKVSEPKIYAPSIEKFTVSCQCVAFRLDDIQDYWLNDVQINLINLFSQNKIPLTVGIIANSFGEDKAITEAIKNNLKKDEITIANHGLDSTPFTLFDKNKQESMLKESSDIIHKKLNVDTKIFIPPQNRFNEDTENVLKENGFTYLSASLLSDSAPFPLKNQELYRFPELATTGEYVPSQNRILGVSADKTFSDAMKAIQTHGFAVITIHPQEYAVFQGGEYINEVNESQTTQLKLLIEKINKRHIQIVSLDAIDSKIKIIPTKDQMLDNSQIPSWIKNNAGWWRDGFVDDNSFLNGIEYLITNNIIKIPPTVLESNNSQIPTWVKDNAGWWAEGRISDDDFIYGVSYLVTHGIIIVDM